MIFLFFSPPCMDNNQSLNAAAGCLNPVNGTSHKNCFQVWLSRYKQNKLHFYLWIIPLIQVGYTTTVLAPHCLASDGRCGTYLYESAFLIEHDLTRVYLQNTIVLNCHEFLEKFIFHMVRPMNRTRTQ